MHTTHNAPFYELRQLCNERGITQTDIADKLGKSSAYVGLRLSRKYDWTLGDMYTILDMLHLDPDRMHLLFPRDGVYAGGIEYPEPTAADAMCSAIMAYITEINRGGKIA